MSEYNKILVLEAQKQWEITKGHLRASVSITGATYTEETNFEKFQEFVDKFIEEVEDNGLQYP